MSQPLPTEDQVTPSQKYKKELDPSVDLNRKSVAFMWNTPAYALSSNEHTARVAVVDLHSSDRAGKVAGVPNR